MLLMRYFCVILPSKLHEHHVNEGGREEDLPLLGTQVLDNVPFHLVLKSLEVCIITSTLQMRNLPTIMQLVTNKDRT